MSSGCTKMRINGGGIELLCKEGRRKLTRLAVPTLALLRCIIGMATRATRAKRPIAARVRFRENIFLIITLTPTVLSVVVVKHHLGGWLLSRYELAAEVDVLL